MQLLGRVGETGPCRVEPSCAVAGSGWGGRAMSSRTELCCKVLFKKVKSSRETDRQRGPGGGINLNFRLS